MQKMPMAHFTVGQIFLFVILYPHFRTILCVFCPVKQAGFFVIPSTYQNTEAAKIAASVFFDGDYI